MSCEKGLIIWKQIGRSFCCHTPSAATPGCRVPWNLAKGGRRRANQLEKHTSITWWPRSKEAPFSVSEQACPPLRVRDQVRQALIHWQPGQDQRSIWAVLMEDHFSGGGKFTSQLYHLQQPQAKWVMDAPTLAVWRMAISAESSALHNHCRSTNTAQCDAPREQLR